jgi:hypothetical protein
MLAYMANYPMSNCEIEDYGHSMFAIRPLALEYDAICSHPEVRHRAAQAEVRLGDLAGSRVVLQTLLKRREHSCHHPV